MKLDEQKNGVWFKVSKKKGKRKKKKEKQQPEICLSNLTNILDF